MTLLFGLDSGGSKTIAAVADEKGRVLGVWHGLGLDPMAGEGWTDELAKAVSALGTGRDFAASVLGLSCHGEIPSVSAHQQAVVAKHFHGTHLVLNDVEVACDAAFAGRDGVLLLAGTGSMAWAKVGGKSLRFGGWGEAFGDEGSAFWIGREALSLATRLLDGRLADVSEEGKEFASRLLRRLWGHGGWPDRLGLQPRQSPRCLCRTCPHRLALERRGQRHATQLLRAAAERLAEHVFAARRALDRPELAWSYAGGVFHSVTILDAITERAGQPAKPKLPPVGGALWRAAGEAGLPLTDHFLETLAASLEDQKTTTGEQ